MKNLKSLLAAALFACAGSVFAVDAPGSITTLPEQGCKTAYQLVTPRGTLYYDAAVEANYLTSNCQTGRNWKAGVTSLAKSDSRSQFLLFPAEGEHTYFVYSVEAGKFIYQTGFRAGLTDSPAEVYVWAHGQSATGKQAYDYSAYSEADFPFTIASAYNAAPSQANQINSINVCCWDGGNPDYRWCETSRYDDGNVFAFVECEEAPAAVYDAAWTKVKEALGIVETDPAETAFNSWYDLVMTDMKAVYDANPEWPTVDVPGQKPASVVYAVCQYYQLNNWLFGTMGFAKDWQLAKEYYAGYGKTVEGEYAEALAIWNAYEEAEIVSEIIPVYVEPVLKAEDVSAEVAYYIYTEARGGLTVVDAAATGIVGTSEAGVDQTVDPTDARQQFAFISYQGDLYLYNLATQKFLGGKCGGHGEFTDKPVDPIYFKNEGNGTVMLYFDDDHNINLGGSKQVTIDGWKQKDGGNSFIIKVAEPFDQTPVLDYIAYREWNGNIAYSETPSDIDELLDFDLEFEEARSVEEAPYGVLGAIFDETGDAYAVVLSDRFVDAPFTAVDGKVTVHFTKIADIAADLQPAAKQVANRALGLGGSAVAKAKVVICGKSFLVDGENVYDGVIVKNYDLDGTAGAIQTAIESISTTADAVIYDLQGRRVSRVQNGVVIANGKKIVK